MKERFKVTAAAYVLFFAEGKLLLSLRLNTGFADGMYSLIAGHVEKGESVLEAAIREAKEEAGVDLAKEDLEFAHVMHRVGHEYTDYFFIAKNWRCQLQNMEPEKCARFDFAYPDNLPDNVVPYIKEAIQHIQNKELISEYRKQL